MIFKSFCYFVIFLCIQLTVLSYPLKFAKMNSKANSVAYWI